jgi:hypothetical protein
MATFSAAAKTIEQRLSDIEGRLARLEGQGDNAALVVGKGAGRRVTPRGEAHIVRCIKNGATDTQIAREVGITRAMVSKRRVGSIAPTDVVRLLVDTNPKKPGNKNHPWFQAIMTAVAAGGGKCTVAEAVAAGSHIGEIKYDVAHHFIELEPSA